MNSKDKFNADSWDSIEEDTKPVNPATETQHREKMNINAFSANEWFIEGEDVLRKEDAQNIVTAKSTPPQAPPTPVKTEPVVTPTDDSAKSNNSIVDPSKPSVNQLPPDTTVQTVPQTNVSLSPPVLLSQTIQGNTVLSVMMKILGFVPAVLSVISFFISGGFVVIIPVFITTILFGVFNVFALVPKKRKVTYVLSISYAVLAVIPLILIFIGSIVIPAIFIFLSAIIACIYSIALSRERDLYVLSILMWIFNLACSILLIVYQL